MFTTQQAKAVNVTLDFILTKVTEYDIYAHYIGKFKVGFIYNSPFREDKNPSFGVFRSRNGNLMFKDHGSGVSGNVIKFVQLLFNLSEYTDILTRIHTDLIRDKKCPVHKKAIVLEEKPLDTVIGIVKQDFTLTDIMFWKQFGINITTLNKFKVSSIKYYLCNGVVKAIYKLDNPMYAYQVYDKFKIYRPLGDKFTKWRNNLTEYDIQGYEQLPKTGDLLFITKSLKDVMVLYEMGYDAISPSSESTFIPKVALDSLKKRFKRIIILFDRDPTGCINSINFATKYHVLPLFIHKKFKAKDTSDAVKLNGFNNVKEWLNEELKQPRNLGSYRRV